MEKLGVQASELQNVQVPADIMAGIMKILSVENPEQSCAEEQPTQPEDGPTRALTGADSKTPDSDVDKMLFPDLRQVYNASEQETGNSETVDVPEPEPEDRAVSKATP